MVNLGYCCINLSLKSKKIMTNRTCRKKTFDEKGIAYASELVVKNLTDLVEILKWNNENDVKVFRMSSSLFPWMSEYSLIDLPDYEEICDLCFSVGAIAKKHKQRLSFHPGPFNVLGSPRESVVVKTIKELNQHAEIMDLMQLPKTRWAPINIHCNGVYGDKVATLKRWCDNFKNLSESAQSRLVVENDDRASMYSVLDLYDGIYNEVHVPITFDYHHHRFNSSGLDEKSALTIAKSTWDAYQIKPLFHYSSSRKIHEDLDCREQAHSDFIYEEINTYGYDLDIELEAKSKDIALFDYYLKFSKK